MASTIPKDSLVLVTGANGYIGSHTVDQLLQAGYRVRGTVRSLSKITDLAALWEKKFGTGRFESIVVTSLAEPGAFDEALKGVSGVAHVASDVTFSADPNEVITPVLTGLKSILNSSLKVPTLKSFVLTSSSTALYTPSPNFPAVKLTESTWNTAASKLAWAPPPYEKSRAFDVYSASKAEGEALLWKWAKEHNPHFVVNSVLPNLNTGKFLVKGGARSTGGWILELFLGNVDAVRTFPSQYFVDVQDVARLHVAALTNPEVKNERIIAFTEVFTWNSILRTFHKLRPDHPLPKEWTDEKVHDQAIVDNSRGEELLRALGRSGWTSLEDSLAATIEGY